ncbi:MAG: phage tail sheath subtilisin-like domain-containing protein, partial [Acidobacteriota bacterium]|nr:phage tail sheath subtilisin-like domain-containing protein [Acidobacteriota bacterium]
MPVNYTYPGVYVEEIPSGVHTITGVSTSDTAFVDFFARGPVDEATRITSFADFVRVFGGLDTRSEASYAIQQFYLNGGSVAWVVRVASDPATADLTLAGGSPTQDALVVEAANPGSWGNNLQVAVDRDPKNLDPRDAANLFNLLVREVATTGNTQTVVNTETHRNLSMSKLNSRYAIDVVNDASSLVRLKTAGGMPGTLPDSTGVDSKGNPVFLSLGVAPSQSGGDGVEPGSSNWAGAAGAAAITGGGVEKKGFYALEAIAPFVFNILCLPAAAGLSDASMKSVYDDASAFCEDKRAFLIVDIPRGIDTPKKMIDWLDSGTNSNAITRGKNAAVYFPRLLMADPLSENRLRDVGASGTMAGVYARTDSTRGVWKAPAGTDASLLGASLAVKLTDLENGALNPLGINALRNFPIFGNIGWGARTLEGADQQASEWKYIPVRRTALYIEESLFEG